MNSSLTHTSQRLFSIMLIALLWFPIGVQVSHAFTSSHEHTICSETKTHLHELDFDCDIYDFHFQSFHISFNTYKATYKPLVFIEKNILYQSVEKSSYKNQKFQRGPPVSI